MSRAVIVRSDFNPVPSVEQTRAVRVNSVTNVPAGVDALGIAVGAADEPPAALGLGRAVLSGSGFDGKLGQTLAIPAADGPLLVAVGIGDEKGLDAAGVRDAAAAFARVAGRQRRLAISLEAMADVEPAVAAQMCVEGMLLARYSYDPLKREAAGVPVESIDIVVSQARLDAAAAGAARGRTLAGATMLARDLANTPPAHLTAIRMAEVATEIAAGCGLEVEVFDRDALVSMGCGGLIGVNGGSADEPRMIRLRYQPAADDSAADDGASPRLALVAKGIMYDSGGLSLKPADAVHATMKNDMSGAAAVLAAMSVLGELNCPTVVSGYLMCTDNVPSGTALRLGDVITMRGGTTVEVINADAEGRLVMADALVLAAEEHPDAIVDIATLTGACLRALGTSMAGVLGTCQPLVKQVLDAGAVTGELAWQLPLQRGYRGELDSDVADLKNVGGVNAGAITAALFLAEFTGGVPWAHIDIAGTAQVDSPASWRPIGCSGFGARMLTELALNFTSA
jgi:leucyl aminopeptidase